MHEGGRFAPSIVADRYRRFLSVGLFVAGCSFFWSSHLFASSGTEGAAFLDIPVGAGPAALGSAYTALAHDAYAPVYNPAGLGFLNGTQVAAQHLSYLESMDYEFLSFVHPVGNGKALGFSAQYLGTGDIAGTDTSGLPNGNYSDHYGVYSVVYGQKVSEKLSVGLTGKWINAKLADVSANAYAADLGSLYQATNNLKLAATVTNIGTKLTFIDQADSLPLAGHLAAAYQPEKHWNLAAEGVYSKTGLVSGRAGFEWSPMEMISIRTGYKSDTTKGLSPIAGFTTGLGLKVWGQEFAYAWLPYGDLGDTQYFSLLIRFGQAEEEKKNLIQYQTIKQHQTVNGEKAGNDEPEYNQLVQLLEDSDVQVAKSRDH
jgi:hypothetical protein